MYIHPSTSLSCLQIDHNDHTLTDCRTPRIHTHKPTTRSGTGGGLLTRSHVAALLDHAYGDAPTPPTTPAVAEMEMDPAALARHTGPALRRIFGGDGGGDSSVDWPAFAARVGGEAEPAARATRAVLLGWLAT